MDTISKEIKRKANVIIAKGLQTQPAKRAVKRCATKQRNALGFTRLPPRKCTLPTVAGLRPGGQDH
jgi:hypothetical protein